MAHRSLLTKKALPEFTRWLVENTNCEIEPLKGSFECLRFRINDTLHIVFENHRSVYLTIQSKTIYLVRMYHCLS